MLQMYVGVAVHGRVVAGSADAAGALGVGVGGRAEHLGDSLLGDLDRGLGALGAAAHHLDAQRRRWRRPDPGPPPRACGRE